MDIYREALWSAYAILQRLIPDILRGGYVSLDSRIVDISAVFEAYARTVISEFARNLPSVTVKDGNIHPVPFLLVAMAHIPQNQILS
jgi:5-methylcytosine-specific restriction enzyme subunit McrC